MELHEILLYPLMGEKATILRERENKLTFMVNDKATKSDIKKAVEELYDVKVLKVNVLITQRGKKKAYVKLHPDYSAEEIASQFGVL
ncbi:MAG: 50S ribosomal protein L23 [Candidatus Altiarchaeales archaeon]|nr:MAG: 50S ribosomal protein L23 [Candidatus Altiarchaeales archaeon]RLI95476.1 MAG: 50S ribosomal protein L23 [Candidatus Altiarchaeales archaeon]HDO82587.1 50S ribosomal protein L23 [Candidatus Altiarchaeales archaeon]HEX55236.1 50S ribosomal protein L23 [Candidatus Altiarchaeales archaeon]